MEASSTFRYAKNQGVEEERQETLRRAKRVLFGLCTVRFGETLPSDASTVIESQNNIDILDEATIKAGNATTFEEVFTLLKG